MDFDHLKQNGNAFQGFLEKCKPPVKKEKPIRIKKEAPKVKEEIKPKKKKIQSTPEEICLKKMRFRDIGDIKAYSHLNKFIQEIYQCEICGGWHFYTPK